jgi:hypothetical protein
MLAVRILTRRACNLGHQNTSLALHELLDSSMTMLPTSVDFRFRRPQRRDVWQQNDHPFK